MSQNITGIKRPLPIDTNVLQIDTNGSPIQTTDARIEIVKQLIREEPDTTFLYVLWVMGDGLGHDQIYSKDLMNNNDFWKYSKNCVPTDKQPEYMEKVKKCTNNTNTKATMNAYAEAIKTKFGMYSGSITFTPEEGNNGYTGNWTATKNYTNEEAAENEDKGVETKTPDEYFLNKLGTQIATLASIDSVTGHMLKQQLGEFNNGPAVKSYGTNFATQSADPATSDVNTLKKYGFKIADNDGGHSDNLILDPEGQEVGNAMFFPFKISEGDGITLSELGYYEFNNDIVYRKIKFQNNTYNNPEIRVYYSSTGITIENVRAVDKSLAKFVKEYVDKKNKNYKISGEVIDKKKGQEKKITIVPSQDKQHLSIKVDAGTTKNFMYDTTIPMKLFEAHPVLVRATLLFLKTSGDYSFSRATWLNKDFTPKEQQGTVIKSAQSNKILLSIDELAVEFTSLMSNFKFGIRTYQSDAIEILLANLKETGNQAQLIDNCKESIKKVADLYKINVNTETPTPSSKMSSSTPKSRIVVTEDYSNVATQVMGIIEPIIRGLFSPKFGNVKEIIQKLLQNEKQKYTKSEKQIQELFKLGMVECFIRKYIKQAKINMTEKYKVLPICIYNFQHALNQLDENKSSVFNLRKIYESQTTYAEHITNLDVLKLNINQDVEKLNYYFNDPRYKDFYTGDAFISYVFKFFYEIVPLNNYDSIMAAGHASLLDMSLYSRVATRKIDAEIKEELNPRVSSGRSVASSTGSLYKKAENTVIHREVVDDVSDIEKEINKEAVESLENPNCEKSNYDYDIVNEGLTQEEKDEEEDDDNAYYREFLVSLNNVNDTEETDNNSEDDSSYTGTNSGYGSDAGTEVSSNNGITNINSQQAETYLTEETELEDEIILFALPEEPFKIKDLVELNIKNYGPPGVAVSEYKHNDYVKYYLTGITRVTHYLLYSNMDEMKIVEQQREYFENMNCNTASNNNNMDIQSGGEYNVCMEPSIKILCEKVIGELVNEMGVKILNVEEGLKGYDAYSQIVTENGHIDSVTQDNNQDFGGYQRNKQILKSKNLKGPVNEEVFNYINEYPSFSELGLKLEDMSDSSQEASPEYPSNEYPYDDDKEGGKRKTHKRHNKTRQNKTRKGKKGKKGKGNGKRTRKNSKKSLKKIRKTRKNKNK